MYNRLYLLVLMVLSAGLFSCTQTPVQTTTNATNTPAKPVLMGPFKYHKMIEASPGDYFDILSWGRGAGVNEGSFMILRSDSANRKFTTTNGDLNGAITNVYNADMDLDGNPEILIETKVKDTINYTNILAYEFNDGKFNKLDFPKLAGSQKKGYHGDDKFYMKEGRLIREFPIYDANAQTAKPTGAKRVLEYSMHNSNFSVKQLSKDSTDKKSSTAVQAKPEVKDQPKKASSHHETHKKKKKHHHSN